MTVSFSEFKSSYVTLPPDRFFATRIAVEQSITRDYWLQPGAHPMECMPSWFFVYMNEAWIAYLGSGIYMTFVEGKEISGGITEVLTALFEWWQDS
jgi:hypothetical protein